MEWLSRWWKALFRDVLLTGAGLAVIGSQVFSARPNLYLIGCGLSLTFPSTYIKFVEIAHVAGIGGGSGPPSLPPGPEPSPLPSGRTGD